MSEPYRILIVSPFCNEEQSIPLYIESLLKLDYSKELIDLLWVENNSSDNSWNLLKSYYRLIKKRYNYHSFSILKVDGNYPPIPKEEFGSHMAGKRNVQDKKLMSEILFHFMKVLNFMLDQTKDNDFTMFWFPDALGKPDFLKRFLKVMEDYSDCGWVGGVMHRRFPRHRKCLCDNPNHPPNAYNYGICSPYIKFSEIPPNANPLCYLDYREKLKFPYVVGFLLEDEILERQRQGNGIFNDVCSTAHIWLIRKTVVEKGLKFRKYPTDFSLAADQDMERMGYKMYCDSYIYFEHISCNGKIYRHDLSLELSDEELEFEASDEKKVMLERFDLEENEQFVIILTKVAKKTNIFSAINSFNMIKKPSLFKAKICPLSGRILTTETWKDTVYYRYRSIMENKERLDVCINEAQRRIEEMPECIQLRKEDEAKKKVKEEDKRAFPHPPISL